MSGRLHALGPVARIARIGMPHRAREWDGSRRSVAHRAKWCGLGWRLLSSWSSRLMQPAAIPCSGHRACTSLRVENLALQCWADQVWGRATVIGTPFERRTPAPLPAERLPPRLTAR